MKKATRQGALLLTALCLTAWLTGCAAPREAAEQPGAEAISDALTKSISTEQPYRPAACMERYAGGLPLGLRAGKGG